MSKAKISLVIGLSGLLLIGAGCQRQFEHYPVTDLSNYEKHNVMGFAIFLPKDIKFVCNDYAFEGKIEDCGELLDIKKSDNSELLQILPLDGEEHNDLLSVALRYSKNLDTSKNPKVNNIEFRKIKLDDLDAYKYTTISSEDNSVRQKIIIQNKLGSKFLISYMNGNAESDDIVYSIQLK